MSKMVAPEKIPQSLHAGKSLICEKLGNSSDLKFKEMKNNGFTFLIVYISTIVENKQLEELILPSLASFDAEKAEAAEDTVDFLRDHVIALKDTRKITNMNDAVNELLFGNTVILLKVSRAVLQPERTSFLKGVFQIRKLSGH